jgi:hypothetical protein
MLPVVAVPSRPGFYSAAVIQVPTPWPASTAGLEIVRKLFDVTQRSFRDGMQGAVRSP